MKNSTDPSTHRDSERQIMAHVERLLGDDRLRIDTIHGRRPVTSLTRIVNKRDGGVELKRTMSEMNVPDRELEAKMPAGQTIECTLSQKKWFFFKETIGKLLVVCVSPTRALLAGEEPKPMATADVNKMVAQIAPTGASVPTTVVLVSTGGFTLEAHEAAERRADWTLILAEPNDAGGWSVYGPSETKALVDLFDPEESQAKADRVKQFIDENKVDLLGGGLAADRIAGKLQLPQQVIEAELKNYARENAGLSAKRLDGRVVLFRESAAPGTAAASGGFEMPFIDKVKSLFARKGDNEKKVAFLSERRTALSQQRDRMYEDLNDMEQKEAKLRDEFKTSNSALTKRRLTSQLLQFRKDIERRQQLLAVLNQQVNVVSTHLHNLELVRQGQGAKLPDSEEITADAVAAEEMLASLEADNELAGSVGNVGSTGLSAEEQALYDELEAENSGDSEKAATPESTGPARTPAGQTKASDTQPAKAPTSRVEPRRNEPEAG